MRGREGVGYEIAGQRLLDPAGNAAPFVAPALEKYIGPVVATDLLVYCVSAATTQGQYAINPSALGPAVRPYAHRAYQSGKRAAVDFQPPWRVGVGFRHLETGAEFVRPPDRQTPRH